jgi:hypothetical protein
VAAERVEHGAQHGPVDRELLELALEDSAAGVLGPIGDGHESQHDLTHDLVRMPAQTGQESLGALHQRAGNAADGLVGGMADPGAAPVLEQLGQRVLQQRQRAGSIGHRADQLGHQRGLEGDAVPLGREGDRPLQLVTGHRRDDLGSVAQQLTDTPMLQRPVVEVGTDRGDDPNPALFVGDRGDERVQKALCCRRVDLGEQLLELVDHEHQLRVVVRQHPLDGAPQPAFADEQLEER